jgi:hypothetical protein
MVRAIPCTISFGKPRAATGMDVGEGVILRYDEKAKEVVDLTIVGVGRRLEHYMAQKASKIASWCPLCDEDKKTRHG